MDAEDYYFNLFLRNGALDIVCRHDNPMHCHMYRGPKYMKEFLENECSGSKDAFLATMYRLRKRALTDQQIEDLDREGITHLSIRRERILGICCDEIPVSFRAHLCTAHNLRI